MIINRAKAHVFVYCVVWCMECCVVVWNVVLYVVVLCCVVLCCVVLCVVCCVVCCMRVLYACVIFVCSAPFSMYCTDNFILFLFISLHPFCRSRHRRNSPPPALHLRAALALAAALLLSPSHAPAIARIAGDDAAVVHAREQPRRAGQQQRQRQQPLPLWQ